MKKVIIPILLIAILSVLAIPVSAEVIVPENIRVGLYFGDSAPKEIKISSEEGMNVKCDDVDSGFFIEATFTQGSGIWTIIENDQTYEVTGTKITISTETGFLKVNGKPYRGQIELLPNGANITVVNFLGLEEYLYGVVPLEMSTGWPIEALKTQAVCARTYAAKNAGKYMSQGFDVYNTTMSQVYGGVSVEKDDCTKAVDETRGVVVTYDGKLIDAVYFSTSIFHTFNVKDVWGSSFEYLSGVDDSYQKEAKPEGYQWTASFTKDEVNALLNKKGIDIGDIKDITVDSVSKEGAVTSVTFKGENDTYTVKNSNTRSIFGLKSQSYTIEKEGAQNKAVVLSASGKTEVENIKVRGNSETLGSMTKIITNNGIKDFTFLGNVTGFKINGSGYGHGLGMSQYGAKGMANSGFTFEEIIKHYYTGTELEHTYIQIEEQ